MLPTKLLLQKVIYEEVLEGPGLLSLTQKMSSRSLIYGYRPQHLPKRIQARLNLGPQRHQGLSPRPILIQNTFRDGSEDIIVALQSRSLKLFGLLLSQ